MCKFNQWSNIVAHDIGIENNKLFSTALMLKYTAFYLIALGLRYS